MAGYWGAEADLLGAQRFSEDSCFGVAIRVMNEDAAGSTAQAIAVDVGYIHEFSPLFAAGVALRGLGQSIKAMAVRDPIPTLVALGGRWTPYDSPAAFYFGGEYSVAGPAAAGAGAELTLFEALKVRGGAEWREAGPLAFSAGVGGHKDMWNLDYVMSSAGDVGLSHRVSLSLRFRQAGSGL
jgi:hypothetical protein